MNTQNRIAIVASTLESLASTLGPPSRIAFRLAFRGADEGWMLRQGQSIASETVLVDGATFVRSTQAIWATLPEEKRARLLGYTPDLDAVIVGELAVLRDASARYDQLAQDSGVSVSKRRQIARDAFSECVNDRITAYQTLRDLLGASHPTIVGLDAAMKPADSVEVLANSVDTLSETLHAMRHGDEHQTPDHELIQELDAVRLDDALIRRVRATAQRARETAALVEARPQYLAAAQRALDLQDGRVLHVIGLVTRAFRRARRNDNTLLAPELGDLARIFGATSPGSRSDDDEPTPPTPPVTPTPPAPPAPVG